MNWTPVATVTTTNEYVYTPIVNGTLFKFKHIRVSAAPKFLKIIIRQAFENEGTLAFYDYKLISYKTELDIVLFSLPSGLSKRKLAIKRADNLLEEDWTIEIEQLDIVEDGINLPINISDVTNLQLQLDAIQAELTLKALDLDLDIHVLSTENPHAVTLNQLGGESVGIAQSLLTEHELSVDHPTATNVNKGMMSDTDKARLDSMANNATSNESNAFLLNRTNHQGIQPISTVEGLQGELTAKALGIDLGNHTANINNPHKVTALQIGAELTGSAVNAVTTHESTTNHPVVTTTVKGMMTGADKSKIDGIAPNATANQTNAFLSSRTNHTGTQLISTVEGLQGELTAKALGIDLGNHTANINNPHKVTALQIGAELTGSAVNAVTTHESTTNHPVVTTTVKGMMTGADKSKIDGIAPNATANQTNAFLSSRTNHTGTQLISTVEGLQGELTAKALGIDLGNHTANINNPHKVTALQIGAELTGSAVNAVTTHESTTNHPVVTTTVKGMMAGADKSKLDGIAVGSTANQPDAFLLARSNHQGTQPISTINGLQNALNSFVNLTTSQIISGVKSFNNLVYLGQHLISNSYVSAANFYLGNTPLSVQIGRTTTNQNHYCTDIGYFDIPNGGVSFRLCLIVSDANFSLAKIYTVVTTYQGSDSGWLKLVPVKESILTYYNNCEIDIRMYQGKTYLRVRRSGGNGDNGTAIIRIEFTGFSSTYFEETFAVAIDPNVTSNY